MWADRKRLGTFLVVALMAGSAAGAAAQEHTDGVTEAVWISGSVRPAPSCSSPGPEVDGGVERLRDVECSPQMWTSSDPRLTGEVVRRWNQDIYRAGEGAVEVGMDAAFLHNDDGDWACSNSYVEPSFTEAAAGPLTFTCTGAGSYAGLSAILVLKDAEGNAEEFSGLLFSGDFPPQLGPPAIE